MRIFIFIALLMLSCTGKEREREKNHEAIILHNSIVQKANYIEHRLNELNRDPSVDRDSLDVFHNLLKQWKSDLVEVPGNDNHDHHDHAHTRHPAVAELTSDQILEIQKELDKRLSLIGKRISAIKSDSTPDGHDH